MDRFNHSQPTSAGTLVSVRLRRLVRLLSLLETGAICSCLQLVEQFNVCRRTIFRDIELLREADVPIVFDRGSGAYFLARESPPVTTQIEPEELAALLQAAQCSGPFPRSIAPLCQRAASKLLASAAPPVRRKALKIIAKIAESN